MLRIGYSALLLLGLLCDWRAAFAEPLTAADIPVGAPERIRELIVRTFSEHTYERIDAAAQLGEIRGQAVIAVPFLLRMVNEYDAENAAAIALVKIGEPALDACVAHVRAAMQTPVSPQRHLLCGHAILCIGRFQNPRAVDFLLELLGDDDAELRKLAVEALRNCTDARATLPLLDVIAQSKSRELQMSAIRCFLSLRDGRAVEPLLDLLEKRNSGKPVYPAYPVEYFGWVVAALGEQRDRRAAAVLLSIAKQPAVDRSLSESAANALCKIGDPTGIQWLIEVLADDRTPDPHNLRMIAAEGLGYYRGDSGTARDAASEARILALLTGLASNPAEPFEFRMVAVQSLGNFGSQAAIATLSRIVHEPGAAELKFWAAVSAVKVANGKLNDASIVRAINDLKLDHEADAAEHEARSESLKLLETNGGWRVALELRNLTWLVAMLSVIVVGALIVVAMCVLLRKRQAATFSQS